MILSANGESYNFKTISITPNIILGHSLQRRKNGSMYSIDRGVNSDRYECELSTIGTIEYIDNLVLFLNNARVAKVPIELSDVAEDEMIFGENFDVSSPFLVALLTVSRPKNRTVTTSELSITIRAIDRRFFGTPKLPDSMCLFNGWTGGNIRSVFDNVTIYGSTYQYDQRTDTHEFEADYFVTLDDCRNLLEFHRTTRGNAFAMEESLFTVKYPFGIDSGGSYPYNVRIKALSIEQFSPTSRIVKITLIKDK